MTHAHRTTTPLSTQDTTRIDDLRIGAVRPLITPALLQEWLPTPPEALALWNARMGEARMAVGTRPGLIGLDGLLGLDLLAEQNHNREARVTN